MLIPRRVKHRKQHHPSRSGAAKGGTRVTSGEWMGAFALTEREAGSDAALKGPRYIDTKYP